MLSKFIKLFPSALSNYQTTDLHITRQHGEGVLAENPSIFEQKEVEVFTWFKFLSPKD